MRKAGGWKTTSMDYPSLHDGRLGHDERSVNGGGSSLFF